MAGVQLEMYTSTSITDLDALRAELADVHRAGFAIDNAESTPDVRCVAAPIQDTSGETIAAISISGPLIRMTDDRLTECTSWFAMLRPFCPAGSGTVCSGRRP